jgi:hypothetical protein
VFILLQRRQLPQHWESSIPLFFFSSSFSLDIFGQGTQHLTLLYEVCNQRFSWTGMSLFLVKDSLTFKQALIRLDGFDYSL